MPSKKHSEDLEGKHSFLSPSQPAWLRYDDEKLQRRFMDHLAHLRGTEEHEYAKRAIKLGHKMPDEPLTMNMYVNDCIGWRLKPEVLLYWSPFCFGHADALGFSKSKSLLRVSDLKTGKTRTTFDQLIVYAALWFLENEYTRPWEFETELRIYQSNKVKVLYPDPHDDIFTAMDRILTGTRLLEEISSEYFNLA